MTKNVNLPEKFQALWANANIATMADGKYNILNNAALAMNDGKIVWIGDSEDALQHLNIKQVSEFENNADVSLYDVAGKWIIPGLIDCHTHVVFGGNRSNEFEARLEGFSYTEIAKSGGGILATVNSTRELSHDDLLKLSAPRVEALLAEGVIALEIKSGYGLSLDSERKMLQVAEKIQEKYGVLVKKTFLAAHATPPEFNKDSDKYIDEVINMMTTLHQENLIDAVDGFCEDIAFSREQMDKVFAAAQKLNLPVKLHAEQLTNQEGASLVASYQGLSADHIEFLSDQGIAAMKENNTVGVLLPGAFYVLNETQKPPVAKMREAGINMAVATDCNPGTSPVTSLFLSMNMACTLFGLTPEEALAGVTINAAKALAIEESLGSIEVAKEATFSIYDIDRPADLSYLIGLNKREQTFVRGNLFNI